MTKLSKFIFDLIILRLKGIKYVDFWISYDIPPNDCYYFIISDKKVCIKNWEGY